MNNRTVRLIIIILSLFTLGSSMGYLHTQTAPNQNNPPWAQAIMLIDDDLGQGIFSLDEAVRLRLQALRDPYALPAQYQPPVQMLREPVTAPKCGLPEMASMSVALFKDYDQWSIETKDFIENEMQKETSTYVSSLQLNDSIETSHFNITWDPNTISDGQEYAEVLGPLLEQAWELFENDHGYKMPDPSEYYYILNNQLFFYEKFEINIVNQINLCSLFPISASAFSMPGRIQFNVAYLKKTHSAFVEALAAHELFHLMQWDYIGFRRTLCSGELTASLFYGTQANRGAWLMEGSSTWIEKLFYQYPINSDIGDYNDPNPDWSLFLYDQFRSGNNNREYGTALFLWYLESFHSGQYIDPVVKTIWSEIGAKSIPPLQKDTVDILTEVLLDPAIGSSPYNEYTDLWQSLFADFILADYLKDDYKDLVNNTADWGGWPNGNNIVIMQSENPNINNPQINKTFPPIEDPGAFPIEIFSNQLGLPDGEDQTGVTLLFELSTNCPYCAIDQLVYESPNHSLRDLDEQERRILISRDEPIATITIIDFGASPNRNSPGNISASEQLTILFTSGAGGYGGWGYSGASGAFNFFQYKIQLSDNPPIKPMGLNASINNGDYPVTLDWDEVREDGIRYNVYMGRDQDIPIDESHRIAEDLTDPMFIVNSGGNGDFYYVVTALDQGGTESEASEPVHVSIGPPTPTPITSAITIQINQSPEDAGLNPGTCQYSTTWREIYFGECDNGTLITSGFRFGNVPIPQNAQIIEAYIEFTTDGQYVNIPILVRLTGQASGNAQPFSALDSPTDRPLTSALVDWDIPASDTWELGMVRQSPSLKLIVQEIVSRQDWHPYNGMAFIANTLNSASLKHRRVIGYDRTEWYPGPEYAAKLIVNFIGDIPPSPQPSPTLPPTPTPTPTPSCVCIFNCNNATTLTRSHAPPITGTPGAATPEPLIRVAQVSDLIEFAQLLYDLRDQLLSTSPEGQHYISVYQEHSLEIVSILLQNPELYDQGYQVLKSLEPLLKALLAGEGETQEISSNHVEAIKEFLNSLAGLGSEELVKAIQDEQTRRPLEYMIVMNMEDAWNYLNGYDLIWLHPLAKGEDPYQAQLGSTIPIQFSIFDMSDVFVEDKMVFLNLVNDSGEIVSGAFEISNNPTQGIKIQGTKYHFDLKTKGLEPGTYTIEVWYNSATSGKPAVRKIILSD